MKKPKMNRPGRETPPQDRFQQIKAIASEHFKDFLIVVRCTVVVEGKLQDGARLCASNGMWAAGAADWAKDHLA